MKERRAHTLQQTKGGRRPSQVIFFDTETKQIDQGEGRTLHKLKLGVAKFCRTRRERILHPESTLEFTRSSELWSWLDDRLRTKSTTYLVAHNLIFDLIVCDGLKELKLAGWELTSWYSKGMVSIFRWKQGDRRLIGLDNGNFFKGKLDYWGDLLEFPKLEVDPLTASDEELWPYCHRDVDIMRELWIVWLTFLDEHDCGSFKPTVSSTAFETWRHGYMKHTVHIHNVQKILNLERESYKGGRTECLWVGQRNNGPFYYLDVNNMYGWVLAEHEFPAGVYGSSDDPDLWKLAYRLERYAVIARVTVEVNEPWFPAIVDGHQCYPLGEFTTTLTTPELKLCIDRGWLRGVEFTSWYRSEPLFRDYVLAFHKLRGTYHGDHDRGFDKICKMLIHGLYGKFGQRGIDQAIIGECDPSIFKRESVYDEGLDEIYDQVYLAGHIYRERKVGESFHSFTAIAAHVTAYARLQLYELVARVPKGHIFYMDTDSLIVDSDGYNALEPLINPNQLGALKIELKSPWLEINAPKDYAMQDRLKRKGIRPDAIQDSEGKWIQTHWPKLSGIIWNELNDGYITTTVRKRQRRVIYSGSVGPGGWVDPHRIALPLVGQMALPLPPTE